MNETLGKRIAAHRRSLGLTQDRLAELLGVTAQAVSKWENDQSCPDITMLPKLAEIFGVTTDEMLGIQRESAPAVEVVTEEEPQGLHFSGDSGGSTWDFQWDGGRRSSLCFALWVLVSGGLLLASKYFGWGAGLWDILWPTGLMALGVMGLYPKFSFLSLGSLLFGGYFLCNNLGLLPSFLGRDLLLPALLVLFGLSLLADALRKPKKKGFHITHNGQNVLSDSGLEINGGSFFCHAAFGEKSYLVELPRLEAGSIQTSFAEVTVDLRGCQAIAENCPLDIRCSFGDLTLLVPRSCRVNLQQSTTFAEVKQLCEPAPDARDAIFASCSVSFGNVTIQYV